MVCEVADSTVDDSSVVTPSLYALYPYDGTDLALSMKPASSTRPELQYMLVKWHFVVHGNH